MWRHHRGRWDGLAYISPAFIVELPQPLSPYQKRLQAIIVGFECNAESTLGTVEHFLARVKTSEAESYDHHRTAESG